MGINTVLDVQNIEKHYGKPPNELSVLNKLSLKVKREEKRLQLWVRRALVKQHF